MTKIVGIHKFLLSMDKLIHKVINGQKSCYIDIECIYKRP